MWCRVGLAQPRMNQATWVLTGAGLLRWMVNEPGVPVIMVTPWT